MFSRYRKVAAFCAVLVLVFARSGTPADAQNYPTQPIRIVVGFGPGSAADVLARLVSKQMEAKLGQPIVVENRPGNSSMTAAEFVARAPTDGYTLFMATVANTLNPVQMHTAFNLGRDLAPVALLGIVPNVLVAHPSVPANTLKELIALAKSKPDSLTFGSSGVGTAGHMAAELFNQTVGAHIVIVPYQGGSNQSVVDLLAGRIKLMFGVAVTMAPYVATGRLKALAVAQQKRAAIMPDVPTLAEAGMPGYDAGIWIGLLAPKGTPAVIVDKLSAAADDGLKAAQVEATLKKQGTDPIGGTPKEFADYITADISKWSKVFAAEAHQK
jgi:tripartite-type tricarboxylate transporter receptor subunit TctC